MNESSRVKALFRRHLSGMKRTGVMSLKSILSTKSLTKIKQNKHRQWTDEFATMPDTMKGHYGANIC